MTRQIIERVVSDLSGQPIADGEAWVMVLTPPDKRRNTYRLDLSEAEAAEFTAKGAEVKRRGRPVGSRNRKANGG